MRNLYTASLLATFTSIAFSATTFLPTSGSSTFPACAAQCPGLLQAQTVCTPPSAIQGTQLNYENCFCQTPIVQDLYTTGETLCAGVCSSHSDRQLLQTWFTAFCKQVGQGVDPMAAAQTTLSTSTVTDSTNPTATSNVITLQSSGSGSNGPWIKTHWQWLIMLVVLFFGLLGLGLGARWLKNRHDRKMEQKRATMSGFPVTEDKRVDRERALSPEIWGPHQHMAATNGYQYSPASNLSTVKEDSRRKTKKNGKIDERIEVNELLPEPHPVHSKTSKYRPQ